LDRASELSYAKLLVVDLIYAQFYAVQIQDRALFVKKLEKIMTSPDHLFPSKDFINEVAKRKAAFLLKQIDTYF
jgi:hypothetical protein